jgi:hypothetical protein
MDPLKDVVDGFIDAMAGVDNSANQPRGLQINNTPN